VLLIPVAGQMLNPFTAMMNFKFFNYVQRKKWNKTTA